MDWNQIIAAAINSVLVLMAVQLLKTYALPWLKQQAPWVLPIVSLVIGPALTAAVNALSAMFGYPIDLSPIIGVFAGGTAVALHQIGKQASPLKRAA